MSRRALLVALFFGSDSFALFDPRFDSLARHDEVRVGKRAVSLYVADRFDVAAMLENARNQRAVAEELFHWRCETNLVLTYFTNHVLNAYVGRVIKSRHSLGGQLVGRYAEGGTRMMGLTRFTDPFDVYETAGVGPEILTESGLRQIPTETRLVGRGMTSLPRAEPQIAAVPIRYIHKEGSLEFDEEVSAFLSLIPRWVGGYIELKALAKAETSPNDYGPTMHRLLIREHWTLWTRIPVPYRLPPLTGAMKERADALKAKYPSVPDALLYPDKQEWVVADQLVGLTLDRATAALYQRGIAFDPPSQTFFDRDFEREAQISLVQRERFETEAADRLAQRPSYAIVKQGAWEHSRIGLIDCSRVLDLNGPAVKKLTRHPIVRSLDVRNYFIPRSSPLQLLL